MKDCAKYKDHIIIGPMEKITITSNGAGKQILARIDTGATKSSIDSKLAAELMLGPIRRTKIVKSASGTSLRPMIEGEIELEGKKIKGEFTIADRTHMKYKVLIGRDIIKNGYLVDPNK